MQAINPKVSLKSEEAEIKFRHKLNLSGRKLTSMGVWGLCNPTARIELFFFGCIAPQLTLPSGKYFHMRPSISSQHSNLELASSSSGSVGTEEGGAEARLALIRSVSRTRRRASWDEVVAVRVWEAELEGGLSFMAYCGRKEMEKLENARSFYGDQRELWKWRRTGRGSLTIFLRRSLRETERVARDDRRAREWLSDAQLPNCKPPHPSSNSFSNSSRKFKI